MDLLQIRDQLDEIDKEMVRLFEERMKLVGEVAEFKFKTGKQVFDKEREQAKIASVVPLAQDGQVRKALEKFSEDLRFSDPVSGESLKDMEKDLAACVNEIQQAVAEGDNASALILVGKGAVLLAERNRICKANKR